MLMMLLIAMMLKADAAADATPHAIDAAAYALPRHFDSIHYVCRRRFMTCRLMRLTPISAAVAGHLMMFTRLFAGAASALMSHILLRGARACAMLAL